MAKLTYKVLNLTQASNDITDHIQSVNLTLGRPTALSPFSGNSATITMFSYGGTESLVDINDEIRIRVNGGAADRTVFQGRIASRNFDDQPGLALNSTMQVLINDVMLQAGMANLQNQVLSSTSNQINEIDNLLPQIQISGGQTSVDTATGTFTTNANQRINEIASGDRGILINTSGITAYQTPVTFDLFVTTTVSIGPTSSATQLAYQDLTRIEAASNSLFYTQATVSGATVTSTYTDTDVSTTYGIRTFTATTAQSQLVPETAEWYANAFAEPKEIMLDLTMVDYGQTDLGLIQLALFLQSPKFVEVTYTPPGGTTITERFWPEQITMNGNIAGTTIKMLMTPLTYYANFILNDAVFGVLDTDRLGV